SRSACDRAGLPAADLFPRAGDGVSRPAAVASGGRCQRRRLRDCIQDDRLALACLGRRSRRHAAGRRHACFRHGGRPMSTTLWIIVAGAIATYLSRVGGHLVLSRFEHIHPRVEAALNAVPAAVLTTLVAPVATMAG